MKYYRINQNVLFRHFGDFGYITDNRNFGFNLLGCIFTLGHLFFYETVVYFVCC